MKHTGVRETYTHSSITTIEVLRPSDIVRMLKDRQPERRKGQLLNMVLEKMEPVGENSRFFVLHLKPAMKREEE